MADEDIKKPVMNEIASVERDFNKTFFGGVLRNDDDTLLTRGGAKGLKIYDELERDCHAYAVLQKRKMAVISRPWDVTPASESSVDVKAAELVRMAVERLKFDRICLEMLDAALKGFSVGEVMWEVHENYVLPRDVLSRDQRRFTMGLDGQPRLLTRSDMLRGEELPQRKFIVHRFGAKDGSPYGLGLGHKLFWPVFFKRQDITFWLTFADKFGSPTAVGKYPAGTTPADQAKLLDALRAIAQDAGITIPDGMLVELLEATRSGSTDAYERLARYMDEQISEAVLGETMTTSAQGAGLGSNQASVHNEVRIELAMADADLLSDTLNETLVRWVVELNMPGAGLPKLCRDFKEPEDLKARAERDKILSELGFEPTEEYMIETYGEGWVKKAPAPQPVVDNALKGGRPQVEDAAGEPTDEDPAFAEGAALQRSSKLAAQNAFVDAAESIAEGWRKLMGKRVEDLQAMLEQTGDLTTFRERLSDLVNAPPSDELVEAIARASFAGHVMGRGPAPKKKPASFAERMRRLFGKS